MSGGMNLAPGSYGSNRTAPGGSSSDSSSCQAKLEAFGGGGGAEDGRGYQKPVDGNDTTATIACQTMNLTIVRGENRMELQSIRSYSEDVSQRDLW